jgi:hypothetical protein
MAITVLSPLGVNRVSTQAIARDAFSRRAGTLS